MSRSLACPTCKTPLVRGEGTCSCGEFFFTGRVRGPTRGGQLRVGGRNYYSERGGSWHRIEWELKDVRGEHPQTEENGRVTRCACCEASRATDYRTLPGALKSWTYGR